VGARAGRKVLTLQTLLAGDPGQTYAPGNVGGSSLHAGVAVGANQRNERERLCRYISRPVLSEQGLSKAILAYLADKARPVHAPRRPPGRAPSVPG